MNKHIFVFVILFSVACPASLKAGVKEEWKNIGEINQEQTEGNAEADDSSTLAETDVDSAQDSTDYKHVAKAHRYPSETLYAEKSDPVEQWKRLTVTPLIGRSWWQGMWNNNTSNNIALGLALEIPVSRLFSAEIEGGYSNFLLNYSGPANPAGIPMMFNQYLLGANGKVYFTDSIIRPYVGAGLMGVAYDHLYQLGQFPVMGDADLMAGVDVRATDGISIGARASWLFPLINKPYAPVSPGPLPGGMVAAPGTEQAALVSTNFFRVMGTVSFKL